jgi:hypothetical protein
VELRIIFRRKLECYWGRGNRLDWEALIEDGREMLLSAKRADSEKDYTRSVGLCCYAIFNFVRASVSFLRGRDVGIREGLVEFFNEFSGVFDESVVDVVRESMVIKVSDAGHDNSKKFLKNAGIVCDCVSEFVGLIRLFDGRRV